jgi:hypothetical protein
MLGWLITVYRQLDGDDSPAQPQSAKGVRIAIWQAGLYGLQGLDELAKSGEAVSLGGTAARCGIRRLPDPCFQ